MVYTQSIHPDGGQYLASTQYTLKAEILQQAEADDHPTIFHGIGNFKHRQRMTCQDAGGERAAPCLRAQRAEGSQAPNM